MPIYAYRCEHCGHAQDVLQKVSDPLLTVCPACGQATYRKQVTAAGFQLKGSGWYVTDFRDNAKKAPAKGEAAKPADGASNGESAGSTATSDGHASNGNGNGADAKGADTSSKPAATAAPAAKPPPASAASA